MSGKMHILKEKFDFLRSTNCELLTQMKGNLINNCDIFKFIISVMGGHWDCSPRASKLLAMLLVVGGSVPNI
jgi:hypothetical protein